MRKRIRNTFYGAGGIVGILLLLLLSALPTLLVIWFALWVAQHFGLI